MLYKLSDKYSLYKTTLVLFILGISFLYTGCKPSMKIIGSWTNKEKISSQSYNSVFIAVLTQNMAVRSSLENDLAAAAETNGIKAIRSLAVFTPVQGAADSVVAAAFVKKVQESGCKSILLISLLDSKTDTKYIPGSNFTYEPYPYYGYYGTFYNYYSYMFNTISTPGYYKTDKTYYIESNLYDVETQDILFSVQTKAMNPPEISKATHKFTETLIADLKDEGLLKNQ